MPEDLPDHRRVLDAGDDLDVPADVTSARHRLWGANNPWYRVRWARGLGTSAASRAK